MMSAPLARAASTNFFTFGTEAAQRGRRACVQVCTVKSMTKSAVVLASSVTGLSCGGAGSFALYQSSMMVVSARAGIDAAPANAAAAVTTERNNIDLRCTCPSRRFSVTLRRCGAREKGFAGPFVAAVESLRLQAKYATTIRGGPMRNVTMIAVLCATALMTAAHAQVQHTIAVKRLDPALDALIAPDAKLELVKTGFGFTEGPVWVPRGDSGYLLFSDIPANVIYMW